MRRTRGGSTHVRADHPLGRANEALDDVRRGRVTGAAVLVAASEDAGR